MSLLRDKLINLINAPDAPAIGELRPGEDIVHDWYDRVCGIVSAEKDAPDLLALAFKADELVQEFVGTSSPDEPFLVYSFPKSIQDLIFELGEMANKAIAAAKATA